MPTKRKFVLLPNGFFTSNFGSSYFCGRYRGSNCPPRPVEVVLDFPFDYIFISFSDDGLWVNHDPIPFRFTDFTTPPLPLYMGCQSSETIGKVDRLDYLRVERGILSANGVDKPIHDFPIDNFELSSVDIARARSFIAAGFKRVALTYAWYRPVFFLDLSKDWMAFYLRVNYRSEVDNA